jgi:hypothetical protein
MHPSALLGLVMALAGDPSRPAYPIVLDSQVGPAFLLQSKSHAIGHAFKPVARLGLRCTLSPRIEVGGAVSGLLDASAHYRVAGAFAHGRLALWRSPSFSLAANLAVGAGYNADILHADLRAGRPPVVPYGFLAVDARWSIGARWLIGSEAGWDNLSILRLGVLVGFAFDPSPGDPHTLVR